MGLLDKITDKVKDHHASAEIDHSHNDGKNPTKSDTANWIEKGQGGDRRDDDHGLRAGSLTDADTRSSLSDPRVRDAVFAGSVHHGSSASQ